MEGCAQWRRRRIIPACTAVLLLTATACTGSDETSADPDAEGVESEQVIDVGGSAVGTCLAFRDDVGPQVTDLPTIDCAREHTHEIIGVINSSADTYPGQDALEETAQRECLDAYADHVGGSVFGSDLFVSWLIPTLDSWNLEDDREIICVAAPIDGSPLTGSVANTGNS